MQQSHDAGGRAGLGQRAGGVRVQGLKLEPVISGG